MNTLSYIERAIAQLTPEELAAFRTWFAEFDAERWDMKFEEDAITGRLDSLAEKALKDLQEGRCTEL